VQAAMQLQDQTLPFCIKLVAVGLTLALTGRWVGVELMELAQAAFAMMSTVSA